MGVSTGYQRIREADIDQLRGGWYADGSTATAGGFTSIDQIHELLLFVLDRENHLSPDSTLTWAIYGREDIPTDCLAAAINDTATVRMINQTLEPITRDDIDNGFDVPLIVASDVYHGEFAAQQPRDECVDELWAQFCALRDFYRGSTEAVLVDQS